MKTVRSLIAACVMVSLMGTAGAQAAETTTSVPAGVTATAQAMAADPALARRFVLARKLLQVTGVEGELRSVFDQMGPLFIEQLKSDQSGGDMPVQDRIKLGELILEEMNASVPQILDIYAGYYAANLTEPELTELVALFQRPSMVKFTKLTNNAEEALSNDMVRVGQEAAMRAVVRYMNWKKEQPK